MEKYNIHLDTHGKTDKVFTHEDGQQRDNKVVKEYLKFLAAFEVVEAFPPEFNNIRVDLELSIAEAIDKSSVYFTTWMVSALTNATAKGFAVLYREKILPPLSLNKGKISNNSAAVNIVSEEANKKFINQSISEKLVSVIMCL